MRRGSSTRFILRPMYGIVFVSATGHLASRPAEAGRHGRLRRLRDSVDDVRIPGAATQIAAQAMRDLLAVRRRVLAEQVHGGHDHPRRAEAALQAVAVPEALLNRMQLS